MFHAVGVIHLQPVLLVHLHPVPVVYLQPVLVVHLHPVPVVYLQGLRLQLLLLQETKLLQVVVHVHRDLG